MLVYSTRINGVSYLRPRHVYSYPPNVLSSFSLSIRQLHRNSSQSPSSESRDSSRNDLNTRIMSVIAKRRPIEINHIRQQLRERAKSLSSAAALQFAELGGKLNKISGYEHIESLKNQVVNNEAAILAKRQAARNAKVAYDEAVARRSNSQKEVNDLLQRKSSWTEADVSRFTALVRQDHLYEQEETRAKLHVETTEADVEHQFNELMRTILNRYHEEQVWSDKIRSASTYGSLLALGANIFLFVLAIMFVEPWKRKRLAETFQKRVEHLSIENRELVQRGLEDLVSHFDKQEVVLEKLEHILENLSLANNSKEKVEGFHAEERPRHMDLETLPKGTLDRERWMSGLIGAASGVVVTTILVYLKS